MSQEADTEGATEVVDDLWRQLMPEEAELKSVDEPHMKANVSKRTVPEEAITIGKRRKRSMTGTRADEDKHGQADHDQAPGDLGIDWERIGRKIQYKGELTVEISLVAMDRLVVALQSEGSQLARNEKTRERTTKALAEITSILGKGVDSLNRLGNVVEKNAKERRRREVR